MSWIDFIGYLAALTVLATFCMDTIVPLRGLAIASNVLFILYGIAEHLYPVFFLHAALLPINIVKIVQVRLQVRRASGKQTRTSRQRSAQ
jgi:hypothetical protein